MKQNENAIKLIEKLIEEIKAKSIGAIFDADYQMCVALEVAISRLMNDDLERGERLTRKAGAFSQVNGKWGTAGEEV